MGSQRVRPDLATEQQEIQSRTPILFNSLKAEGDEGDAEEKSEASRSWFMKFKGRNCLSSQGEAASGDVEGTASYLENLAELMNEGDS